MDATHYFSYTNSELEALKSKDKTLAQAIDKIGKIKREVDSDLFLSVIHHIIAQQISSKAQASIWVRFLALFDTENSVAKQQSNKSKRDKKVAHQPNKISDKEAKNSALSADFARKISPNAQSNAESVLQMGVDTIRACGISGRKAEYIIDFAHKVQAREFDIECVWQMSDERAIEELVKLRGIGVWTAEMILLFCLQRKDIFSYDDLAIQRGLKMLYNLTGEGKAGKIPKEIFAKYRAKFSPHCSLASLYLWEIASGKFEI